MFFPVSVVKSPVLVLYDGHKSHIFIGFIEWAQQNHISQIYTGAS